MRKILVIAGVACVVSCAAILSFMQLDATSVPTGCAFPTAQDNFPAVSSGATITADVGPSSYNKVLCAINALEAKMLSFAGIKSRGCSSFHFLAGERKRVEVVINGSVAPTDIVMASVRDPVSPSLLNVEGFEPASGGANRVAVWVFNHDALNARTGTVCATVTPM